MICCTNSLPIPEDAPVTIAIFIFVSYPVLFLSEKLLYFYPLFHPVLLSVSERSIRFSFAFSDYYDSPDCFGHSDVLRFSARYGLFGILDSSFPFPRSALF